LKTRNKTSLCTSTSNYAQFAINISAGNSVLKQSGHFFSRADTYTISARKQTLTTSYAACGRFEVVLPLSWEYGMFSTLPKLPIEDKYAQAKLHVGASALQEGKYWSKTYRHIQTSQLAQKACRPWQGPGRG
jgi:hypothetical protein